ncbi:hypothetical protein MPTK1_7g06930 [Marchantia polymorpha subsp. ruderalis]|uniref:Uncharacterized protein n=2 Tax=Marchantia polymorpha TaxID=3197 RepID=A0AAF6BWX3_MARPO|nr:hypothetical protein MARPO_0233s0001 [Marchantia polymorpha]BBN16507.1 hypothetical protein Mp_7g06930 [Marchantia polymorpha subsp. ruderalis]|eukprot:PTQ27047.1 hypothetical protein MARPO_0233s0001 [Marchantia polymorpha]
MDRCNDTSVCFYFETNRKGIQIHFCTIIWTYLKTVNELSMWFQLYDPMSSNDCYHLLVLRVFIQRACRSNNFCLEMNFTRV